MKYLATLICFALVACASIQSHADIVDGSAWINEVHYDNAGADEGEFVEVVVATGTNVDNFIVELINGSNGLSYQTIAGTAWTFGSTVDGFDIYTISGPSNFIQNGSPDGIALSENVSLGVVQQYQFLSYEGQITALAGNFNGSTSTDIGVSETSGTAIGESLQLSGTGTNYNDFTWNAPDTNTSGAINNNQSFSSVPEPATASVIGLLSLGFLRRRKS